MFHQTMREDLDQAYTMPSVKSINNNKVLIVGLDTRYFRSNIQRVKGVHLPNLEPSATILGS